jgi:hypothetical protein
LEGTTDKQGKFCFPEVAVGLSTVDAEYNSKSGNYHSRLELQVESDSSHEVVLKLERYVLHGCRTRIVDIDEPLMTTVFDLNDLEEIPFNSSGGR